MTTYEHASQPQPKDALERIAHLMSMVQAEGTVAGSRSRDRGAGRWGKGGRAASTLALLVLLASLIFVAYGSLVPNRWYRVVAIEGASMEPTFSKGDAIVITRPPGHVKKGMVVTLQVEGQLVTHRVVGFKPDGTIVTKGDANTYADDWTGVRVHVVGLYRGHIPELGRVLKVAHGTGAWATDGAVLNADATAGHE